MSEWQDNLCIGVLEIDVQHRLLFDKFNAFVTAYQAKAEPDEIFRLFWFIEAYVVSHFKDEEKLMQAIAFPDYPSHHQQHVEFTHEIGVLKERLRIEGPTDNMVSTITSFISGWLVGHISTMDLAIGRFIDESSTPNS